MAKFVKTEGMVDRLLAKIEDREDLMELAVKSGFVKRKPRKINPRELLAALFVTVLGGGRSLNSIAMTIGVLNGEPVSKQGVDKRIKGACLKYLECILAHAISRTVIHHCEAFSSTFNRIVLQDSTTIRLPSHLKDVFPGSRNQRSDDISLMKIQTAYDLLQEHFCYFQITPFTTNDQHAATTMLEYVEKNDLVIRDLGYFVPSSLGLLQQKGAFFISRLRYGVNIYDSDGENKLNLLRMLKKRKKLDMRVVIGGEQRVTCRIVALPVAPAVAAERRRKLKTNRDHRLNPNKEHLELLGWNIFVTNVNPGELCAQDIASLYGLRWRIEMIFKSWKSNSTFLPFQHASAQYVQAYVYTFLIFTTLFHAAVFVWNNTLSITRHNKPLSLLKLTRFFKEQMWAVPSNAFYSARLFKILTYHCAYETRSDRLNHHQKLTSLG